MAARHIPDNSDSDSSDEEDILLVAWYLATQEKQKRKRRYWIHNIIQNRLTRGEYHVLVLQDLQIDGEKFRKYFRMSREQFTQLHFLCKDDLTKQCSQLRDSISARERLALTIRYLATGSSYIDLEFRYRIGIATISYIIPQVCQVLWEKLKGAYMQMPRDEADWKLLSLNFENSWNLPHCLGAIDGKHVTIKAPNKSGSLFFNYKGSFSIVLLAVVDANYRFLYVDVGSFGRNSDGGIFSHSKIGKMIKRETLPIPKKEEFPDCTEVGSIPYYFVGDEAFPLTPNVMRPFPGGKKGLPEDKAVFNYRLCRARRIVENAFGILAARWRVFHTPIALKPENVEKVVLGTTVLHNFLQSTSTPPQIASVYADAEADKVEHFIALRKFGTRGSSEAEQIREKLKYYFVNEGQVAWQWKHVRRGKFD